MIKICDLCQSFLGKFKLKSYCGRWVLLKNDWTIKVSNKSLFDQKNIDPRVLMTVLAFQGDREYWDSLGKLKESSKKRLESQKAMLRKNLEKIEAIAKEQHLVQSKLGDLDLESIATELEESYFNTYTNINLDESDETRLSHFVAYCLEQVKDDLTPVVKKNAILHLLKGRLKTTV